MPRCRTAATTARFNGVSIGCAQQHATFPSALQCEMNHLHWCSPLRASGRIVSVAVILSRANNEDREFCLEA
jgi:hypothetical protein